MNTRIRANAYKLMELVYEKVDSSYMVRNLDCTSLITEETSAEDLAIASRYLSGKGYVNTQDVAGERWSSAKVTADGIDWIEDTRAEAARAAAAYAAGQSSSKKK